MKLSAPSFLTVSKYFVFGFCVAGYLFIRLLVGGFSGIQQLIGLIVICILVSALASTIGYFSHKHLWLGTRERYFSGRFALFPPFNAPISEPSIACESPASRARVQLNLGSYLRISLGTLAGTFIVGLAVSILSPTFGAPNHVPFTLLTFAILGFFGLAIGFVFYSLSCSRHRGRLLTGYFCCDEEQ